MYRIRIYYEHASVASYANIVPRSRILLNLMTEEILSSETSILTRATWRNIIEYNILQREKIF
jgi:hypothetical protein